MRSSSHQAFLQDYMRICVNIYVADRRRFTGNLDASLDGPSVASVVGLETLLVSPCIETKVAQDDTSLVKDMSSVSVQYAPILCCCLKMTVRGRMFLLLFRSTGSLFSWLEERESDSRAAVDTKKAQWRRELSKHTQAECCFNLYSY